MRHDCLELPPLLKDSDQVNQTPMLKGGYNRDEHEYSNIRIFEYFGPRIYIRIRIYYILDIRIYSNIRSKLRIYSNIFFVFFVFQRGSKRATGQKIYITKSSLQIKKLLYYFKYINIEKYLTVFITTIRGFIIIII